MMRRTILGCLVMVSMSCGADPEAMTEVGGLEFEQASMSHEQRAADYLPTLTGNRWELLGEGHHAKSVAIKVLGQGEAGSEVTGLTREGAVWLREDAHNPNVILALNADTQTWGPLIRFDRKTWWYRPTSAPCDQYRVTRLGEEAVKTMVGEFTGVAFRFELVPPADVRCTAGPFEKLVLAKEVGVVALVQDATETMLSHAMIGDTVLHHAQMPTALVLERTEYESQMNTIACIKWPCPTNEVTAVAKFTLAVTNAEDHHHDCEFRTAKQQNFELVNEAGEVVKAWADGREFDQDPTVISFSAQQTRTLEGEVELTDRNGVQLSGTYTVRATMFGHEQHAKPALGTIVVKVVR